MANASAYRIVRTFSQKTLIAGEEEGLVVDMLMRFSLMTLRPPWLY